MLDYFILDATLVGFIHHTRILALMKLDDVTYIHLIQSFLEGGKMTRMAELMRDRDEARAKM